MKRKELLAMPQVTAPLEMITVAEADQPYIDKTYCRPMTRYPHRAYLKCIESHGILKACFFLREALITGGVLPAYELYISKAQKKFITYDRLRNQWRKAKLDRIDWPHEYYCDKRAWIDPESERIIRDYFNTEKGGYDALLNFQREVREEQLLARHRRETDPWDEDLKRMPSLPKDWLKWVDKTGIPEHFIYYRYKKGGAKVGYCTHCGHEVPIKHPRYNKVGRCPRCRQPVTFKSEGKAGRLFTKKYTAYLLQRCRDGFVVREFLVQRMCPKDGRYREAQVYAQETHRIIYDHQLQARPYYWGVYKQRYIRWIAGAKMDYYWSPDLKGLIYGKTLPDLAKNELKKTGLIQWINQYKAVDPVRYLTARHWIPQLEQITKAGLWKLAQECVWERQGFMQNCSLYSAGSLTGMLGIRPMGLKRLRGNNGGALFLSWLQYETASGRPVSDELIQWFCQHGIKAKDLQFITDKMSPLQIRNYLERQMKELKSGCGYVINTWADYLAMAKRLKMDTNDEIIYRVRKLKKRHAELIRICQERESELRLVEMEERYPKVNRICKTLKKYEFQGETYSVLAPNSIAEILAEGDALHHCVGIQGRYMERIEQKESYILFLRKNRNLKKPYYTLEVEPDGTVRQKRTEYDRQGKEIGKIEAFLQDWQKNLRQRLTAEDQKLADTSQKLRAEEFAELRRSNVVIHTGELAGAKLVDVLTADLMVNKAA